MARSGLKAGARKKRRLYLLLTSLAVLGLAVVLVLNALEDNIRLFYDPTEVMERHIAPGKTFRLGGLVEDGSYAQEEKDGLLINLFTVTDGNESIKVRYEGLLPDLFREGQGVVAEGKLNAEGIFISTEVLAKHDEKYMPKEVTDSLKKRGTWQDYKDQEDAS
ncbi:cytochrome c maturation protein CcmE [Paremcibacter congregatus]|uniref:Cytochrome c-type biogenesis protein CcmE n=1 Tax=Paremcibacter congregatus TaxID=2043170 RepID=A0A2G4YSU3_9PROT|nr:cytochrome c maturation protein CcmE [Paremcibacter congregatus]PHZ84516.1 cytochrome c maturation protein CcmE [Paremcibacter congregatus]QDE28735.1 cytochrome c maturation protein CcmE [Paremcibacter congregatus]